jgi:hypothetical protein
LYVFIEALDKDGEDGDHHKIGGMMVEFTVEPWRWRPIIPKIILFII